MTATHPGRLSTGIEGLDDVLHGGLIPERGYMIAGRPGTGKTILGLHYLQAGIAAGEDCLYVNLEEDEADVRSNAASLGFDLTGIEFLDLTPGADTTTVDHQYDIFTPGEVEGPSVTASIRERFAEVEPDRVFIDPLTQLRRFAVDEETFRIQILDLMNRFTDNHATVLFTSQATETTPDDDLQYLSDGTLELEMNDPDRTIAVPKFRGSRSRSGRHSLRITGAGMVVYPRIEPGQRTKSFTNDEISSGIEAVDEMLHGGIERGTITLLSGPTGVGKTTLGTQFMKETASRGERSVIYTFEETLDTILARSDALGIPAAEMLEQGTLSIEAVEALELSAAEFATMVKHEVEANDAKLVMIDGINGYRLSIRGPHTDLERELNSLGRYLKNQDVAVILVDSVDSITGDFQPTSEGVSYLADNIVFLRYIEIQGELRKAIGVLKKRTSDFERTLREFEISTESGIVVGDPLTGLRGILRGTPDFIEEDAADGAAPRDER